jgi:hypothetical protein
MQGQSNTAMQTQQPQQAQPSQQHHAGTPVRAGAAAAGRHLRGRHRHHARRRPAGSQPRRPLDRRRRPQPDDRGSPPARRADSLVSVYAEVRANQFRRSFELSSDLDTGKIDAGLRDGVLTLRIPKLEQAKPRRVEVRVE